MQLEIMQKPNAKSKQVFTFKQPGYLRKVT